MWHVVYNEFIVVSQRFRIRGPYQGTISSTPNYLSGLPTYHPIETVRPCTEVHWRGLQSKPESWNMSPNSKAWRRRKTSLNPPGSIFQLSGAYCRGQDLLWNVVSAYVQGPGLGEGAKALEAGIGEGCRGQQAGPMHIPRVQST